MAGRVAEGVDELPGPLQQREFGDLALGAQPALDLGEREGRAGVGAAGRAGEVGVAAAPVADRGPADAGQAGDLDGGHFGAVRHGGSFGGAVTAQRVVVTAQHSDAPSDPSSHVNRGLL